MRLHPASGACLALLATIAGCFVFIDNPTSTTGAGGDAGSSSTTGTDQDSAPDVSDAAEDAPTLCDKYGGYGTVEAVVGALVGNLVADCRVSPFFTSLSAASQQHLGDCLTKQIAVLMRCSGIKYDVDNNGVACRDMKTSHLGLAIRSDDFDALIDDVVTTLQTAGVAQADIDSMAPALLFLKTDIVTNSAPGTSKSICTDAGADGG